MLRVLLGRVCLTVRWMGHAVVPALPQGVRAGSQGHQLLLGGAQRQAEDHGFDLVTAIFHRLGWIGAHVSPLHFCPAENPCPSTNACCTQEPVVHLFEWYPLQQPITSIQTPLFTV